MDVTIKTLDNLPGALEWSAGLDQVIAEGAAEFRDDDVPPGALERFLKRSMDDPETTVQVALDKESGERLGICVTGPLIDPLLGDRLPVVLLLYVDPDVRHRGLAKHLVDHASKRLEERGLVTLGARAGHNDDALISMGERWGFVRVWELMVRE